MKTLILYVFHQYTENVMTFFERGLFPDPDKEFIIIFNRNPDNNIDIKIKDYANVHLFIRDNIGHDFQGWNSALFLPISCLQHKIIEPKDHSEPYLYTMFDRFVFINSTVAGPYLPLYVKDNWVDRFTSKLSSQVKMTGISVNFMFGKSDPSITAILRGYYGIEAYDHSHLQSTAFSLDREGLEILLRYKLFMVNKQFPQNKWVLICSSEIGMSVLLRREQKCLYSYRYEQGLITPDRHETTGDLWHERGLCFPLCETMFVKTNTKIPTFPERERYDKYP